MTDYDDEEELMAELASLTLPEVPVSRSPLEDREVSRLRDDMSHLALQTPTPVEHEAENRTAMPTLF